MNTRAIATRCGAFGKWASVVLVPCVGIKLTGSGPVFLSYLVLAPFLSVVPSTVLALVSALAFAVSGAFPEAAIDPWFSLVSAIVLVIFSRSGGLIARGSPGSLRGRIEARFSAWTRPLLLTVVIVLLAALLVRNISPSNTLLWAIAAGMVLIAVDAAYPQPHIRWRRIIASLALGAGTLIVCLVLFEVGARFAVKRTPVDAMIVEPHSEAYMALRPNARVTRYFEETGATHLYETSADAVRGPVGNQFGPKKEGEFRIVCLGDSFMYGNRLNNDETIPYVLEALLRESLGTDQITVVNLGVPGYSPWQERIWFQEK